MKLKRNGLFLALIVSLGALLRWPGLLGKTLWYDEAYSAFFATLPPGEIIRLSGYDTTPGLFALLLSFWSRAFGGGDVALAMLSFLFSLGSLAVVYAIGKEAAGVRAGLIAAAFVAVNPLHIRYATEVRAYSLAFFLAALSVLFLQRMVRRGAVPHGIWWAAAVVLGMYSHYTFLFFVLCELAVLAVWASRGTGRWKSLIVLSAAGAISYLPQVLIFRRWDSLIGSDGPTSFFRRGFGHGDASTVLTYFASLAFGERSFYPLTVPAAFLTIAAGLLVAAAVAYGLFLYRHDRVISAAGSSLFAGAALLMAGRFIHSPRYFIFFVLPLALFAGVALAKLDGRRLAAALAAVFAFTLVPAALATFPAPATAFTYYGGSFARAVSEQSRSGDLVLVDHFTDILWRRYAASPADMRLFFPKEGRNVTDMAERFGRCDFDYMSEADLATLAALTEGRRRVWTVDYLPQRTSIQDPSGLKRRWLEEHFRLASSVEFPADAPSGAQKAVLLLYERP